MSRFVFPGDQQLEIAESDFNVSTRVAFDHSGATAEFTRYVDPVFSGEQSCAVGNDATRKPWTRGGDLNSRVVIGCPDQTGDRQGGNVVTSQDSYAANSRSANSSIANRKRLEWRTL